MINLLTAKEAKKLYEDSIKLKTMQKVFDWFNAKVTSACKEGKSSFSISEYNWTENIGDGRDIFEKEILYSGFSIDKEYKDEPNSFNHRESESVKMVTVSWGVSND